MQNHNASSGQMVESASRSAALARYRGILLFIVLFLVFDALILGFNFYLSSKVEKSTKVLNVAASQEILVQTLAKEVFDVDRYTHDTSFHDGHDEHDAHDAHDEHDNAESTPPAEDEHDSTEGKISPEMATSIQSLRDLSSQFSSTLKAFDTGGSVIDGNGDSVNIPAVRAANTSGRQAVTDATELWAPYQRLIDSFLANSASGKVDTNAIGFAVDYVRVFNEHIYFQTHKLTNSIAEEIQQQTFLMRIVQIMGIVGALILFFMIVVYVVRRLVRSDAQIEAMRMDTSKIMSTVNEGLFLLDKDLKISPHYSAKLEEILEQKNMGGQLLTDVLGNILSEKDSITLKAFVKQIYNKRVVEELIQNLNPLTRVEVAGKGGSLLDKRYLDFKFSRIYSGKEIDRTLVSVSDITRAVRLEEQLAHEKDQTDQQLVMLNLILNTDNANMENFVKNTKRRLDSINETLRGSSPVSELQEKSRQIYREVHSLKGEASTLKLSNYVQICQEFESKIKKLQEQPRITGNDFLPLTVSLDELISLHSVVESLYSRLGSYAPTLNKTNNVTNAASEDERIEKYYRDFAENIAERHNKKVKVNICGLNDDELTEHQRDNLRDITIQFVRNAVVHGLETPEARRAAHKNETGDVQIILSHAPEGDEFVLTVEDDGNGIDFSKIRAKALSTGLYTSEQIQGWTPQQLLGMIFSAGFSTADQADEDAGRGVGMDIVKECISRLQGKLKIATQGGCYTRFTVRFPIKSNN